MIVVGGTYSEICFEPIWENIYGSGFRAVSFLLENNFDNDITFYTCCDKETEAHLNYYRGIHSNLKIEIANIFKSPIFYYDHPLKVPAIFPRPDLYVNKKEIIYEGEDNVLVYGLLEASFSIRGKKVVYDPQSPVNPIPFSSTNSKAEELVIILNKHEAESISCKKSISEIKKYFFEEEKCSALIIKMGAKGALLFQSGNDGVNYIPVYQTEQVWTLGSGDIFSSYFSYNWFKGESILVSASKASQATAIYCNTRDLDIKKGLETFAFSELVIENMPDRKIYLAGPFFTYAERWLVNEIWRSLKSMGLNVFSPFHDVGHGKAKDVVSKDLKGLDESSVVFAIIDGLDSGTLFEIGYAISRGKKVIAFVQNEGEESLKMLEGTDCVIEKDLTTAIYKTYWNLGTK